MRNLGSFLFFCAWASLAGAADFCVTTTSELQAALNAAETNGEHDVIRIAQGSYTVPSGGFGFSPASGEDAFDLAIRGGFVFSGPPFNLCNEPVVKDPELTVLTGGGTEPVVKIRLPQNGDIEIGDLSLINGLANSSFNGGGGLAVFQDQGQTYSGVLTVRNNIFLSNQAPGGGGLYIGNLVGTETINVRVLNNLFVGNQAINGNGGAGMIVVDAPQPRGEVLPSPLPAVTLAHNTVVNNSAASSIGGFVLLGNVSNLYVASNHLRGNSGIDLNWFVGSTTRVLRNNNIGSSNFNSDPPTSESGNINAAPQFLDCGSLCVDRIPALGSPLMDAGYQPFGPPFQPWIASATDLNGEQRVRGGTIDIGAYEGLGDRIFLDRFAN